MFWVWLYVPRPHLIGEFKCAVLIDSDIFVTYGLNAIKTCPSFVFPIRRPLCYVFIYESAETYRGIRSLVYIRIMLTNSELYTRKVSANS